jgi:flagellar biosynthesis/type III secretory pathway protein FliH
LKDYQLQRISVALAVFGSIRIPATLPRLSVAGLLLAFGLTAAVATAVGVAAWSLGTTGGYTAERVAQIQRAAYQNGMAAGLERGRAHGKAAGQKKGLSAGEKRGYQKGYRKGFKRGQTLGYQRGHTAGYSDGYSAGQAAGKAGKKAAGN